MATTLTFSQQGEDQHILANTPETGRFLDIGAYHATDLSNVRGLYERGWSGVVVEPSPSPTRKLVEEYGAHCSRVEVVCAAVGDHCGLVKMWISDGPYTTARWEARERWFSEADFRGLLWIPQVTVRSLIEQFGPFHFVNIDTEGTSVDILKQLLATPMDPQCICCEHDGRLVEAIKLAQSKGYRLVDENGCNVIFAR